MANRYKELNYKGKKYIKKYEIDEILIKNNFNWFLDCEIENTRLEIIKDTLILNSGIFYNGTFEYGVIRDIDWRNGRFMNGVIYNGIFKKIIIEKGIIFDGMYLKGDILFADIRGGVFEDVNISKNTNKETQKSQTDNVQEPVEGRLQQTQQEIQPPEQLQAQPQTQVQPQIQENKLNYIDNFNLFEKKIKENMYKFESFQDKLNEDLTDIIAKDEKTETITNSNELENKMKTNNKIIFDKYILVYDKIELTCMIVKDTPRSKFGYKIIQNYRYPTYDRMIKRVKEFIDNINQQKIEKDKRKTEQKKAKENIHNIVEVGDLLYDSWGYDQTNIDFYQITKVGKSSVWIRPIASQRVSGTEGHDSVNVKPVKDGFTGEEVRKLVQIYGDRYYLKSDFGSISKYTQGDKGVMSSWGH